MSHLSRRDMIKRTAVALAGTAALRPAAAAAAEGAPPDSRQPLVFIADLYHPPQDPDDHIDLATLCALPEFHLQGVLLDCSRKFLVPSPEGWDVARDPGFVPVAQLGYLLGRSFPAAVGPREPLRSPGDTAEDRPESEQAAIRLLLEILARSAAPVTVALTGSARILTAAFNRDPQLVRSRTRRVLLNAGATGGPKREWNVMLDPAAYVGLWRSGLPIDWYPCATETGAFNQNHERGTHWRSTHAELFRGLAAPISAWFAFALSGSGRGDIVHALTEGASGEGIWSHALVGPRNLWSTISFIRAAGRELVRRPEGWRFVPADAVGTGEVWPMRLDPIAATTDDLGAMTWQPAAGTSVTRLFGRRAEGDFGAAMTEALNALLRELRA